MTYPTLLTRNSQVTDDSAVQSLHRLRDFLGHGLLCTLFKGYAHTSMRVWSTASKGVTLVMLYSPMR